jgi:putative transposase
MKKKFEYMREAYWGADGIWSDGYFVSTVGIDEGIIKCYIETQGKEDIGQAELEL